MVSSKGVVPKSTSECCMCGDYGLSQELFRCRSCLFRSQHRYCSDLYPKAETYRLCNWCLKEDGEKDMKEATESRSLSSTCSNSNSSGSNELGLKLQRSNFSLQLNRPIKKQRSPERTLQKKNISGYAEESKMRTRSDDVSNVIRSKQVIRGKVRRYKLLEEVSC